MRESYKTLSNKAAAEIVAKVSGAKVTAAQAASAVKTVLAHG